MFSFLKEKNLLTDSLQVLKPSFLGVSAFSAVINVLALVPSIYMLQVYDRVLASSNETTLALITLLVVGLFILAALLESARTYTLVRAGGKFDLILSQPVYVAAFQHSLKTGRSVAGQALRDLTNVRQFITGQGILALFDAPWMPIYLAVVFLLHPVLGWMTVGGIIISFALTYFNSKFTQEPLEQSNKLAIASSGGADANLRNAEVIQAMGMLDNLKGRWLGVHKEFIRLQATASDKAAVWTHATKYFRMFLQSAALGVGALLVIEGEISAGMMIAGSILVGKTLQPIDQIVAASKSLSSTKMSFFRLRDLLNAAVFNYERMDLPEPQPELRLEGVNAAPPGSRNLTLRNVTMTIPSGTVVGVIGPSGAGKSSLVRVITGVWGHATGAVRIGGAEIGHYDPNLLGRITGYLPQDIELFNGTVAENIARFGEIDAEKVVAAAKAADVHDLILRLPEGYETTIGDSGLGLSGGQRQRVALARALYGEPKLIVLDEPNSNLDDVGEAALIKAIRAQREKGSTVILVSHKLSTLSVCDSLIVMSEGMISSAGPTREVLEKLKPKTAPVASIKTN